MPRGAAEASRGCYWGSHLRRGAKTPVHDNTPAVESEDPEEKASERSSLDEGPARQRGCQPPPCTIAKGPKRSPRSEVALTKAPPASAAVNLRPARSRRVRSEGSKTDGNQAKEEWRTRSAKAQTRSPGRRQPAAKNLEQD